MTGIIALVMTVCPSPVVLADDGLPLQIGDRGQRVLMVQFTLISHGYVLAADAIYGPQTARAVAHFQRSSGLVVDGIVGNQTWGVLVPAARLSPPTPTFASDCAEMSWYRQQAGLPEVFDTIGYRESRCRNDVRTWCCYGWYQNYVASHLRSPGYAAGLRECGIDEVSDVYGLSDSQKRKQACMTAVLYRVSGLSPWATG